jgi:hypothetical protein
MSGIKPIELTQFYASLHARGLTTDTLAAHLGVSGAKLRKMIGLLQRRRGIAWKGLLGLLTEREKSLLLHVEQSSTWRNRQRAKQPRWSFEKASAIAAERSAA